MTSEMLNKILKIEEDAAAAELVAKTRAEEITEQAKVQVDAIIAKAQQRAEDNTSAVILKTKQKTAEIEKATTDIAKAEGLEIIGDARKKQPQAVNVLKNYLLPHSGL